MCQCLYQHLTGMCVLRITWTIGMFWNERGLPVRSWTSWCYCCTGRNATPAVLKWTRITCVVISTGVLLGYLTLLWRLEQTQCPEMNYDYLCRDEHLDVMNYDYLCRDEHLDVTLLREETPDAVSWNELYLPVSFSTPGNALDHLKNQTRCPEMSLMTCLFLHLDTGYLLLSEVTSRMCQTACSEMNLDYLCRY